MYHETAYGTDKNDNFVVTRTRYGRIKTRKCLTFFPKNIIIIIIITLNSCANLSEGRARDIEKQGERWEEAGGGDSEGLRRVSPDRIGNGQGCRCSGGGKGRRNCRETRHFRPFAGKGEGHVDRKEERW